MRYRQVTKIEIFFWLFNLMYLCCYKSQQQHIITIPRSYIRIQLNNANRVAEQRLSQKQNINLFSFQFLSFRFQKNRGTSVHSIQKMKLWLQEILFFFIKNTVNNSLSWLYLVLQMLFILHTLVRITVFVKVGNYSYFLFYSMIGYDNYFPCTIEVCFGIYIGLDNRISNKHFFK